MSEHTTAVDRRPAQRIRPRSRNRNRNCRSRSERCEPGVAHRRWMDTVRICNFHTMQIAIALIPWRRGEVLRHETSLVCDLQGLALSRSMAHGTGIDDVMAFVANICRMCLAWGTCRHCFGPGQGSRVCPFSLASCLLSCSLRCGFCRFAALLLLLN